MIVVEAEVYSTKAGKKITTRSSGRSLAMRTTGGSWVTADESEPVSGSLNSSVAFCLPIMSLGQGDPQLDKPIMVLVQSTGGTTDDFVGSVVGTEIGTSGDTLQETVENLKDIISAKYRLFSALPFEKLGPIPRRQLSILRQHIHP